MPYSIKIETDTKGRVLKVDTMEFREGDVVGYLRDHRPMPRKLWRFTEHGEKLRVQLDELREKPGPFAFWGDAADLCGYVNGRWDDHGGRA